MEFANQTAHFKIQDLNLRIDVARTTLFRDIQELIAEGDRVSQKKGYYTLHPKNTIQTYLNIPFYEREAKTYNFSFLESYTPNTSSFLSTKQKDILDSTLSF